MVFSFYWRQLQTKQCKESLQEEQATTNRWFDPPMTEVLENSATRWSGIRFIKKKKKKHICGRSWNKSCSAHITNFYAISTKTSSERLYAIQECKLFAMNKPKFIPYDTQVKWCMLEANTIIVISMFENTVVTSLSNYNWPQGRSLKQW